MTYVLRGARQVGKSTLANQFGEEYDVYLKGKQYRLISLPFYYAGILDKTLDRIMAQM